MDKTTRITAAEYRRMLENKTDAADINTIHRNRQSNDRGRGFENLLMKGCRYYAQKEQAVINKVYEPYMCLKLMGDGKFVGQFTGRAEPDFKGVLKGGKAIAFEAKSTQKEQMKQNILTKDQQDWLDEQQAMGALALVCINIQERFFTIPWTVWKDMKELFGRKHITAADIPQYEVIFDGAVRFLEYIGGGKYSE